MTHAVSAPRTTPRSVFAMRDQVEILLVDDRPENLLALEAILEPLGQRLVRANSGDEALRKLLQHDIALVMLDVQMPGMNGFETAQIIKSRERTKFIPIIFLTAINKEQEHIFRGYQVGAVDYISKPFQPDVLRAKVAVFVDLQLKQKRIAEQEALLRDGERRESELRHVREMLQSEARFRDMVDTAMDAIVLFDDRDRMMLFNAAAERMFGASAADAIGCPVTDLFPDARNVESLRALARRAHTVTSSDTSVGEAGTVAALQAKRRNGDTFPIEMSISSFDGKDGRQYTLIMRDVSERVRQDRALREQAVILERTSKDLRTANDELNRRKEDLERAMTARSRFYASMSHELRTPINAVLGYSTLLLENIYGPLNEKQTEGIQRTQRAAKHLLELVNDVLDLSKIEAGKIDLRLQPVSFPGIVEELFVTVRPLADKFQTKLSLEHEGGSISIVSDPRRVRQILLNLLSNAIKFGKSKPIAVRVSRMPDDGVSVSVIDQGDGIAPEEQDRIFQEFVQLGKTHLQEGTGLGLPISRRLAELLHGSLILESALGEGSTFRLTLPPNAEMSHTRVSGQHQATDNGSPNSADNQSAKNDSAIASN